MKRFLLLLSALLLTIGSSAPLSAKGTKTQQPDSLTIMMKEYTKVTSDLLKAQTDLNNSQEALKDAQEALKTDSVNINSAAAEVKADSIQHAVSELEKKANDTERHLMALCNPSSDSASMPIWLALLLGVLLVGISIIGGMRWANIRAKKRRARQNQSPTVHTDSIKLACEKKDEGGLFVTVRSFQESGKYLLRKDSKKGKSRGKRGNASQPQRTYLLQTVRVSTDDASIEQFRLDLKNYYGKSLSEESLKNLLDNGYTPEGMERRVYHLPLKADIKKLNDKFSQSIEQDGQRYFYEPFSASTPKPDYEAPFAPLDQLLQKIAEATPDASAVQATDAQQTGQPQQSADVPDEAAKQMPDASTVLPQQEKEGNAEKVDSQSNTVVWNISNQTAEPHNDASAEADGEQKTSTTESNFLTIRIADLEAIRQARQKEKSALQELMRQGAQTIQALSGQGDISRQLSEEQSRSKQLSAQNEELSQRVKQLQKELSTAKQNLLNADKKEKELTKRYQLLLREQQLLTQDNQRLNKEVTTLKAEVERLQNAQVSYTQTIDFWPELQSTAQDLLQFLDAGRLIEQHAEAMSAYEEGKEDDRNYYLVRIARKLHGQLSAVSGTMEALRTELPLLAQHQMVRTDGWIYSQLRTVKQEQRSATLHQLIKKALIQMLNATVIAADEYAYWLPEMIGVSDCVAREFTPLRDDLLAKARKLGLKVRHIQPFTPIDPTNTNNIEFWPDEQHRWKPGTVIEVFSLAIDGTKGQVKATP